MRVAVCVISYQRPDGLRRLLASLLKLRFRDHPPAIEIVVVDNDAHGSAAAVCDALRSDTTWPIRHEIEPQRGISFARNKAIATVVDTADFVAWIDDDEVAEPDWLDELLRVQRETGSAIVTGPVEPCFSEPVAAWMVRGRFFASRRYPTGALVDVAYTHNVLVSSEVFRVMGQHFDEAFAMTGGSDSEFFRRAYRAGHTITWADEALVREWIPRSRACTTWLVKRSFRAGITLSVIAMKQTPGWRTRLVSVSKAGVWCAIGAVVSLVGLVSGRAVIVKGLRFMAYGVGTLASVFGTRFEEYRTVHGT